MKKLLIKTGIFVLLNAAIGAALLTYIHYRDLHMNTGYGQSESVLITLPENETFGLLVMGSSHGRMFSRQSLHDSLETITRLNVCNISKWSAGVIPEQVFLDYFYSRGNHADKAIYFIDPFALYSPDWNENLYVLNDEPFRYSFAWHVLLSPFNGDVSYNYVKSKFTDEWKNTGANTLPDITGKLDSVSHEAIRLQLAAWFRSGVKQENLDLYFQHFREIIEELKEKGVRKIIVMIPPSLMGHFEGIDELTEKMKIYSGDSMVVFRDYNNWSSDPALFYDHSHLNAPGAVKFMKEVLKDICR